MDGDEGSAARVRMGRHSDAAEAAPYSLGGVLARGQKGALTEARVVALTAG